MHSATPPKKQPNLSILLCKKSEKYEKSTRKYCQQKGLKKERVKWQQRNLST